MMERKSHNDALMRAKIQSALEEPGGEKVLADLEFVRDLIAGGAELDGHGQEAIIRACLDIAIILSQTEVEALQWFFSRLLQIETEETAINTLAVLLHTLSDKLPEVLDGLL